MTTADVVPTLSPSMDIQVSSNFERLLFEMNGRDGGLTAEQLQPVPAAGRLESRPTSAPSRSNAAFRAARFDDDADPGRRSPRCTRRPGCCSTRTRRSALARRPRAVGATRRADGDARHRPPGEVPRRRRGATGIRPPLPPDPRRPVRPPGADIRAAERPRRGGSVRRPRSALSASSGRRVVPAAGHRAAAVLPG